MKISSRILNLLFLPNSPCLQYNKMNFIDTAQRKNMTKAIMLLGTHSDAGKSLLATAFCRVLANEGFRVAPFKAQNMSNNAGVTSEGGEMGRAQIVQAEAAKIAPHTDMNPILLKPEGNRRSQVVLNGKAIGHIEAGNWDETKVRLWKEAKAAYDRLAARYDVIVMEGAGSPAEINLKSGDITNLRMAAYADAPCLLIGDIDRGGVFAALAGTMLLLEPEERQQIQGFLINRFRGEPALLGDGLEMLQERAYGVPTLGVIPFVPELRIASEDAVVLERGQMARDGGLDIVVIHLPRISNFDEFDLLAAEKGVQVRYVSRVEDFGDPDAVILPGTKATIPDLEWLRQGGLEAKILDAAERGCQVVGICGGYQMLGQELADPQGVEGPAGEKQAGLGLLPVETVFQKEKHTWQARMVLPEGLTVSGYEIHTGQTRLLAGGRPFGEIVQRGEDKVCILDGARSSFSMVWGTYLHDIFTNDGFRQQWLTGLGWLGSVTDGDALREADYDRLAEIVKDAVDWPEIKRIMGLK
jgi:adenosylcobyric acid synthase